MSDPKEPNAMREWPAWLQESGPGSAEALIEISQVHGRLHSETAAGFRYQQVLQHQIKPFVKAAASADGILMARTNKWPKAIILANMYDNGSSPKKVATLSFASRVAVVRLLETFHESISRADLMTGFIAVRGIIEHVGHYDAVIRSLRSFAVPETFEKANEMMCEIHSLLAGKIYGTRVNWKALFEPDADARIEKNKLKYEKEEDMVDRTAGSILNGVDGLDKKIKGTRAVYEILCEFAHPNVGLLMACTEAAEQRKDDFGIQWVEKRLGLGEPGAFVEACAAPLARVLKQCARCLSHFEKVQLEGVEIQAKLLKIVQVVTRDLMSSMKKDYIGAYALCPCGSGKKVRFCCAKK